MGFPACLLLGLWTCVLGRFWDDGRFSVVRLCLCCCWERGVGDIAIGMGAGRLLYIDVGMGIGMGMGMNTDFGSCGWKFG